MILSRSARYALQALVLLAAAGEGRALMARELAAQLNVPAPYLAKLMQRLTRRGILASDRGPHGGYRLTHAAYGLSLRTVVHIVDGERATSECLLGFKACSDEHACAMHCRWRPVKEELFRLLDELSVAQLASRVRAGRCTLQALNPQRPPAAGLQD